MNRPAAMMLLALISQQVTAATGPSPFRTIQEVFAAFSSADVERIEQLVTPDFELLAVGEIWDRERTLTAVASTAGQFARRNYFQLVTSEIRGDTAWVSYWNRATYESEEGLRERAWLESAVLVLDGRRWKIRMLHSTRLAEDQLPEDVELTEFVDHTQDD